MVTIPPLAYEPVPGCAGWRPQGREGPPIGVLGFGPWPWVLRPGA